MPRKEIANVDIICYDDGQVPAFIGIAEGTIINISEIITFMGLNEPQNLLHYNRYIKQREEDGKVTDLRKYKSRWKQYAPKNGPGTLIVLKGDRWIITPYSVRTLVRKLTPMSKYQEYNSYREAHETYGGANLDQEKVAMDIWKRMSAQKDQETDVD